MIVAIGLLWTEPHGWKAKPEIARSTDDCVGEHEAAMGDCVHRHSFGYETSFPQQSQPSRSFRANSSIFLPRGYRVSIKS